MRCAYLPLFLGLIPTLSLAMESPRVADVSVDFNGHVAEVPVVISPNDTSTPSSPTSFSSDSSVGSSPSSSSRSSLLMGDQPSPLPESVSHPSLDSYAPVRGRDLTAALQDLDDEPVGGRDLAASASSLVSSPSRGRRLSLDDDPSPIPEDIIQPRANTDGTPAHNRTHVTPPTIKKSVAWEIPSGQRSRYQNALRSAFNDTSRTTNQESFEQRVIQELYTQGTKLSSEDRILMAKELGYTVRALENASPDALLESAPRLKTLTDIVNLSYTTPEAQRAIALLNRADTLAKNEYCLRHPTNRVCAGEHQFED